MATIDIGALIQPVAADDETGPDLEYDAEYIDLFRIAAGTPERRMGGAIVPAQEPDWPEVARRSSTLLGRSKDLRLAVLLTRAALMTDGMPGVAAGLAVTHQLLERYWEGVHPRLDPDDGDPTERVNSLLPLADRDNMLDDLRKVTLAESRVLGPVSFRGVEIANGHITPAEDETAPDPAAIAAIFKDCDAGVLAATAAAASDAAAQVDAIATLLDNRLRSDQAPDLSALRDLLGGIRSLLAERLAERDLAGADGSPGAVENPPETPASSQPSAVPARLGEIRSREDVVRTLDRICDYYSRNEPSSPVPLLLRRAQRLATGSFIEIVRDLAPDALKTIEKVCGAEESA